jgi:restriction system protein
MARRGGFFAAMARSAAQAQREAERAQRRDLANRTRAAREADRAQAAASRSAAQFQKEVKQRYTEARLNEVEDRNADLETRVAKLRAVLESTLNVDDSINFASLRVSPDITDFVHPDMPPSPNAPPSPPGLPSSLFGGREKYDRERATYDAAEAERRLEWQASVQKLKQAHELDGEKVRLEAQEHNEDVQAFESAYLEGDRAAIELYTSMVLERSQYPDDFPQIFRVAYVPASREMVVEYQLPTTGVIPVVSQFSYIRARDTIQEKPRKIAEIRELYQDVVAAVALRTMHEIIEADQGHHLDIVTFSGYVSDVDRATGRDIQPCLISVRVIKTRFSELTLAKVDKLACLRNLGATVSPRPSELQAVKPLVQFDMVDRRFVDQPDLLSDLEARPNLMELTPTQFEQLVANLFERMGLDTKLTRASRDGGVDAVVFDTTPVTGGKLVIQAKRYRHTVGVAAVRDLYGTVQHEGANRGILVTTSGYGPDAFTFATDKPLELIDGGGLLYLLEQNGVPARIVFPEEG